MVRRIPLPNLGYGGHVVAALLSPVSPDFVWVGCSNGRILRVDWTTGSIESFMPRGNDTKPLIDMAVQVAQVGKGQQEILFTSERVMDSGELVAYNASDLSKHDFVKLYGPARISFLRSAAEGRFLVGVSDRTVLIGSLVPRDVTSLQSLQYQFYSFDISDEILSLDVRVSTRGGTKKSTSPLDLVVGCERGSIFVYEDIIGRLRALKNAGSSKGPTLPRKYHWHRKTVHSVKWSRDGKGGEPLLLVFMLTVDRQLPHIRRLRDGSRLVAAGLGQARLSAAFRRQYREHCRLAARLIICHSHG